ncbi:MAG: hypothetical protein LBC35_04730 [Coriobacteriales bacterium]|jgi:hypothetical protein|nr:hypothetical protein [Coriobacteriales bacterium]
MFKMLSYKILQKSTRTSPPSDHINTRFVTPESSSARNARAQDQSQGRFTLALTVCVVSALLLVLGAGLAGCGNNTGQQNSTSGQSASGSTSSASGSSDSSAATGLPNPVVQVNGAGDIEGRLGFRLQAPGSATTATYSIIDNSLGQVQFSLDDTFTYRGQKTDALTDISGMYYDFATRTTASIANTECTVEYNEGAQGVCYWYDASAKASYSVSVEYNASFDLLTTIAQILLTE